MQLLAAFRRRGALCCKNSLSRYLSSNGEWNIRLGSLNFPRKTLME